MNQVNNIKNTLEINANTHCLFIVREGIKSGCLGVFSFVGRVFSKVGLTDAVPHFHRLNSPRLDGLLGQNEGRNARNGDSSPAKSIKSVP